MKSTGIVRLAEASDLPLIHEWLKHEECDGLGFINNWGMIQKACAEQEMIVFVADEGPIGFLTHGISLNTILQTKSSCQRQGIGRALVEHALAEEEARGNAVVVLQCEPKSSVEFWLSMGFEAHRDCNYSDSIYMHRLSKAQHTHVQGDDLSLVTINVYPEAAQYTREVKPDRVHYVMAKFDPNTRTLDLAHRISIASESALGDQVVEIDFGGFEIYKDKAKRPEAAAIGLKPTPNFCGWYLDVITIDSE
ncbi:GNAT family N-acetyltransferase [Pseudomonas aeruginosa]|nr:GNAT family N-acetyltransferase [Pseudomonas aeruginosa]MBW6123152.1 GNAT family N-acetyltransferase [Pseudomonas aeruginosa]